MFNLWGSKDQQEQSETSPEPWYSPSLVTSATSSRPQTSGQIPSHISPGEAAGIIALLEDKSVDDLRKLLSDNDAYQEFLLSLDQVTIQNNISEELHKETLQIARVNSEKEPQLMELRNQCRIIRTTELATAEEKLVDLERQKEEILNSYSTGSLLHGLQGAINKVDEESEALQQTFLEKDIDTAAFVQNYKNLRSMYHRRALIHLAAKTSFFG